MTKILMTKTELGSDQLEDGRVLPVKQYLEGEEYEVSPELAKCFLEMKVAKPAGEKSDDAGAGAKKGAPENKAKKGAPETKGA